MIARTGKLPSYLTTNGHSYCFRIRVPHDLTSCINRAHIKFSLRTGSVLKARSKAMILGVRYKQLFRWARYQRRMGKMTEQEIQDFVDLFVEYIGDADLYGVMGMTMDARGFSPEDLRDKINKAKDAVLHYKQAAETEDYTGGIRVDLEVDDLLAHTVKDPPAKGSPEYEAICRKAAEALVGKWEAYQKHHTERLAGVYGAVRDGVLVPQQAEPVDEGPRLSEVLEQYTAYRDSVPDGEEDSWSNDGRNKQHLPPLKIFIEFMKDAPIKRVKHSDCYDFRTMLRRYPRMRFGLGSPYRDKSLDEIIEEDIVDRITIGTINNYGSRIRGLFKYARHKALYDDANPATDIRLKDPVRANEKRAGYTTEELRALFRSTEYLTDFFDEPFQFWVPLIALFHGMRQREIAQLYVADIQNAKDGTPVFRIVGEAEGESVKNAPSRRLVPIRPFFLDKLNILGFRDKVKASDKRRLFPELRCLNGSYGWRVSRWFNQTYKKNCGISVSKGQPLKDFHSFRKTFITRAARLKTSKEMRLFVAGHSMGKDEQSSTYIEPFDSKQLLDEVIAKIDFHKTIDLSHLKRSKFVPK